MRRGIAALLALTMLISGLCMAASAAASATDIGFHDVGTCTGVTLTVDSVNPNKLHIALSGTVSGYAYMVMLVNGTGLPTKMSDVCYVDSCEATGTTTNFTVYPKLAASSDALTLYITSNYSGFTTKSATAKFTVPPMLGDVDGNRTIETDDATLILQNLTGEYEITELDAADVNGNDCVDVMDASLILQHLVSKYVIE